MARRRRRPEPHGSHERWLVSYADFITLLFAFFTTMYAISTVDAQKMSKMVASMQVALKGDPGPAAPVPPPQSGLPQPVVPRLDYLVELRAAAVGAPAGADPAGERRDRRRLARPRRLHPRGGQLPDRQRRPVRGRAGAARRHRGAAQRAAASDPHRRPHRRHADPHGAVPLELGAVDGARHLGDHLSAEDLGLPRRACPRPATASSIRAWPTPRRRGRRTAASTS